MPDPRTYSFYRPIQQSLIVVFSTIPVIGACAALYFTRFIFLTLLIGLGLGIVIQPVVDWIRSTSRLGQKVAVPVAFVFLVSILAGVLEVFYVIVADQIIPLSKKMPQYLHTLETKLSALTSRFHFLPKDFSYQSFETNMGDAAQAALSALTSSAGLAGDLIFILVVCLYYVSSPKEYFKGFISLFPAYMRPEVARQMKRSAISVRQWFGSQVIAMVIVGVLVAVALSLLGHEYGFLLGIITGLLELVPFLGPITAFFVGGLITLSAQPEKIVPVLIVFFLLLQVEGNLIIPLLMKDRIKLPPIHLLTIMLIFAYGFGLPGLLIATPMFAVVRTLYLNIYVPRMNQLTQSSYLEASPIPEASCPIDRDKSA